MIGMLALTGIPASAQQVTLKLNKPEYATGDSVVVTAEGRGPRLRKPMLWLEAGSGSPEENQFVAYDLAAFLAGKPVTFPAPRQPGEWKLELHDLANHDYISAATLRAATSFRILASANAVAQAPGPRPAEPPQPLSPSVSARGLLSMVEPHAPVLGEQFAVSMPLPGPGVSLWLRWWAVHDTTRSWAQKERLGGDHSMPYPVEIRAERFGPHVETVIAPYNRPGQYELGLFRNAELFDVLPVQVLTGTAPNGLQLFKKVFRPGDPIEFKVTLPPNRYYYGHHSGPSVMLYPLVVDGKQVGEEEGQAMASSMFLNHLVYDSVAEGIYSFASKAVRPGTYTVTHAIAAEYRLTNPLFAPKQGGRWEVRLYDRGFDIPLEEYIDLVLAVDTIVVEPVGASPSVLRFVREQGSAWEELKTVAHGDSFYVEARFDSLPDTASMVRVVTLEWVENGTPRSRAVSITAVSRGLFRSKPLVLVAPADPPVMRDRQP